MNEGKKDRRDPIRTVKPRNFVAKNAMSTTSGAGAHKDKKKAMKQGDVKHKNKEYAESLEYRLASALKENSPEYDDEAGMSHGSLHTIRRAAEGLLDVIDQGDNLPEWCQEKISLAEDYLVTVWDYIQSEKAQGVDPEIDESGLQYYTGKKKYGKDGMAALAAAGRKGASQEELGRIKDRYIKKEDQTDDLRDSVLNVLQTIYKGAAAGEEMIDYLADELNDYYRYVKASKDKTLKQAYQFMMDNGQEAEDDPKMMAMVAGKAIEMLGSDVSEGLRDPKDNPCWKGYKPVGTKKKGGRTVPNCVPKEGWTHDTLAAQLFETENTYEQYLANRLKEQLNKK